MWFGVSPVSFLRCGIVVVVSIAVVRSFFFCSLSSLSYVVGDFRFVFTFNAIPANPNQEYFVVLLWWLGKLGSYNQNEWWSLV